MAFGKKYLNQNTGHGRILMKIKFLGLHLREGKISIKFAAILSMGYGSKSPLDG